jgi:hypothetical protein
MSIQISWLVENRIIYWLHTGDGTISNTKEADIEVIKLLEASSAPLVHIILDLQELKEMPSLADSIRAKYDFPKHPKNDWNIFVGMKDPLQKMIVSFMGNVFKMHSRLLENNIEALDFLQSIDSTLPDLTPYKERFKSNV